MCLGNCIDPSILNSGLVNSDARLLVYPLISKKQERLCLSDIYGDNRQIEQYYIKLWRRNTYDQKKYLDCFYHLISDHFIGIYKYVF